MSFNPKVSNIGGSGHLQSIDYTPAVAVNAGDVVILNGVAYFALSDIAAGALGSLVFSGGVWGGNKTNAAWTNGQAVYYNPTGNPVTGTAGTGAFNQTGTGTFVGFAVLSPPTGVAAAVGDSVGWFVKTPSSASGLRAVAGQVATVTASDTVVTGLNTVIAVVASLDSAPVLTCDRATASIGNQTGAPAAGSILVQTWMPTSNANPTPIAATTFGKNVNFVAYGY